MTPNERMLIPSTITGISSRRRRTYPSIARSARDGGVAHGAFLAIERAVVLCRSDALTPTDLPPAVSGRTAPLVREAPAGGDDATWLSLSYAAAKEQALRRFEKGYVDALMKACDNNISAAARTAGMDRSNFKRVLRKYRSDVDSEDDDETGEEQPGMQG